MIYYLRETTALNSCRFPMNIPSQPDQELEQRLASPLLDVLIRAGLILAMAMLCYRVFSPFLHLMVWALILAVTLYPLHQFLASKMGGKQGLAATLLVIAGIVLIVAPTAMLMSSLGDSVRQLVNDVQNNTLKIPAPRPGVEQWPVVGEQIHDVWSKLHADLPALVQSMQPKIGELAKTALGFVASIGGGVLQFLASFIIAGIIMAFGQSGSRASRAIFERIIGHDRGSEFARPVHGDHSCRRPRGDRGGLHPGHHRRVGPAGRRGSVGRRAGGDRAGPRHRPGAGADRDPARHRLHLVERQLQHCGGDRLHRGLVRVGHGGQRAEAADARQGGRCADAGHSARRAGWHGDRWNPGDVRRCHPSGARLSDLHGLGGGQPKRRASSGVKQRAVGALNYGTPFWNNASRSM